MKSSELSTYYKLCLFKRSRAFFAWGTFVLALSLCLNSIAVAGPYNLGSFWRGRSTVSYVWPFDSGTESLYTFNSSLIDMNTAGVCRLIPSDVVDDDNSAAGFAGGTSNGVAWYAGGSYLKLGSGGSCDGSLQSCAASELSSTWTPAYANIIAYFKLNGTVGSIANNAAVTATVGSNGTAKNANGTGMAYAIGQVGTTGITLDGVDDYISVPNLSFVQNRSTVSFAGWVKPTTDRTMHLFGYSIAGTPLVPQSRFEMQLNSNTSGALQVQIGARSTDAEGTIYLVGNYGVPVNKWSHIAAVVDYTGKTADIYINGLLNTHLTGIAFAGNTTPNTASANAAIGAEDDGSGDFFVGSIDEFGFWQTALTASQVDLLYSRQSSLRSGTLTSRVFDATTAAKWSAIAWVTTLPFYKSLPDYSGGAQNEVSADYSQLVGSTGSIGDNNLMSTVTVLWHFDETSATGGAGNDIADNSGGGKPLEGVGTPTFGATGALLNAVSLNGSTQYFTHTYQLPKATGTLSQWLYPTGLDVSENRVAYYESNGTSGSFNGWTTNTQGSNELEINTGIFGGNWSVAYQDNNFTPSTGISYHDTLIPAVPNKWTHLVMTWDRTSNLKVYLDGVLQYTKVISGTTYASLAATVTQLGKVGDGTASRFWLGKIDETAVWSRALQASEVLQLYRRGANRVKFQARVCSTSNCSDDPNGANWQGPTGNTLSQYSELYNAIPQLITPGAVVNSLPTIYFANFNPLSIDRYFQYRATLESDDTSTACNYGSAAACSPELKSVTVTPPAYNSTSPTIVGVNTTSFSAITGFQRTVGASCAGFVTFNISKDKTNWYYWTGSAWGAANGTVAQSNTASVINTNAASITPTLGAGTYYFRAFLTSDGSSPCELSAVTLTGKGI